MHITKISNTNFQAGNIYLKRISPNDMFNRYEDIANIARRNNIDIEIFKHEDTDLLPIHDLYTINAKCNIDELTITGSSVELNLKHINKKEVAENIYMRVLDSVKKLGQNITKRIGKNPEFH